MCYIKSNCENIFMKVKEMLSHKKNDLYVEIIMYFCNANKK